MFPHRVRRRGEDLLGGHAAALGLGVSLLPGELGAPGGGLELPGQVVHIVAVRLPLLLHRAVCLAVESPLLTARGFGVEPLGCTVPASYAGRLPEPLEQPEYEGMLGAVVGLT